MNHRSIGLARSPVADLASSRIGMAAIVWTCSAPDAVIDPLTCGKAGVHSVEDEALASPWAVVAAVWSEWPGQATSASGTRNTCRPGTAASTIPSPFKPLVLQQTKEAPFRDTLPGAVWKPGVMQRPHQPE